MRLHENYATERMTASPETMPRTASSPPSDSSTDDGYGAYLKSMKIIPLDMFAHFVTYLPSIERTYLAECIHQGPEKLFAMTINPAAHCPRYPDPDALPWVERASPLSRSQSGRLRLSWLMDKGQRLAKVDHASIEPTVSHLYTEFVKAWQPVSQQVFGRAFRNLSLDDQKRYKASLENVDYALLRAAISVVCGTFDERTLDNFRNGYDLQYRYLTQWEKDELRRWFAPQHHGHPNR